MLSAHVPGIKERAEAGLAFWEKHPANRDKRSVSRNSGLFEGLVIGHFLPVVYCPVPRLLEALQPAPFSCIITTSTAILPLRMHHYPLPLFHNFCANPPWNPGSRSGSGYQAEECISQRVTHPDGKGTHAYEGIPFPLREGFETGGVGGGGFDTCSQQGLREFRNLPFQLSSMFPLQPLPYLLVDVRDLGAGTDLQLQILQDVRLCLHRFLAHKRNPTLTAMHVKANLLVQAPRLSSTFPPPPISV